MLGGPSNAASGGGGAPAELHVKEVAEAAASFLLLCREHSIARRIAGNDDVAVGRDATVKSNSASLTSMASEGTGWRHARMFRRLSKSTPLNLGSLIGSGSARRNAAPVLKARGLSSSELERRRGLGYLPKRRAAEQNVSEARPDLRGAGFLLFGASIKRSPHCARRAPLQFRDFVFEPADSPSVRVDLYPFGNFPDAIFA